MQPKFGTTSRLAELLIVLRVFKSIFTTNVVVDERLIE